MRGLREIQSTLNEQRPERARHLRRLLRQAREGEGRPGLEAGEGPGGGPERVARAGPCPGEGAVGVSSGPRGAAGTDSSGLQLGRGCLDSPCVSGFEVGCGS